MSGLDSIVDNDREEATDARNAVDGGGTRRVAGALIDTTDLPDAAEVQGL